MLERKLYAKTEKKAKCKGRVAGLALITAALTLAFAGCSKNPRIEGLKYIPDTKTYLSLANNPYNVLPDLKEGVLLENNVKSEGKMYNSIGLKYDVIEEIMKKNEEKKIYSQALPFDLTENPEISLEKMVFLDKRVPNQTGVKINKPVTFYSPINLDIVNVKSIKNFIIDLDSEQQYTFMTALNISDRNALIFTISNWNSIMSLSADMTPGKVYKQEDLILTGHAKGGEPMGRLMPQDFLLIFNQDSAVENPDKYQMVISSLHSGENNKMEPAGILKIEDFFVFVLPNKE